MTEFQVRSHPGLITAKMIQPQHDNQVLPSGMFNLHNSTDML